MNGPSSPRKPLTIEPFTAVGGEVIGTYITHTVFPASEAMSQTRGAPTVRPVPGASGPGDDGFAKAIRVAEALEDVPSATGRRLVFTLRDTGRPEVMCEEGSSEECAVVVWNDGTGDLGNKIRIHGGQGIDLTLTSDGALQEQPEGLGPGSLSTSVGGAEQSWSVVLDQDLPSTGEVALELVMTKLGDPNVLMEWTLRLEDVGPAR